MMSPRLKPVELAIKHVRDGGNRVPVVGVHMGKGPANSAKAEAARDLRLIVDVNIIVVVQELVPDGLAKHNPHKNGKKNADCTGGRQIAGSASVDDARFRPFR